LKISNQKSSTDYEWRCPDCARNVRPLSVETGHQTYYHRRAFCDCPAGQAAALANAKIIADAERMERIEEIISAAGLDRGQYARFRFNRWDPARNAPHAKHAFDHVLAYADQIEPGGQNWLYLHGAYGLGKTHLAVAALRRIAAVHLWSARVVVWPELCQATKESWSANHGPTEAQLWARVRSARVLLIDDIDKTSTGEWAMGKLYGLINYRLTKMLPTIITANASLTQLRETWRRSNREYVRDLGMATLSRIAEGLWGGIEFKGEDQRWVR
jgi:DNA replication protein DnaC